MVKFVSLIPARKGSKRVPNKNLRLIKKKPLIYYSINASKKSKFIFETVVYSDSKKINYIAKKFGAVTNYKRPKKISENSTSMYETINYFVKKYNINEKFDYLVLLQPTSPLRNTFDINNACRMVIKNSKADGLLSTFYIKKMKDEYPNKFMIVKKNFLKNIDKKKIKYNHQVFLRNGPSIFIIKIKSIKKKLYNNNLLNFIMPEKRSLDLNTFNDFKKLKSLI